MPIEHGMPFDDYLAVEALDFSTGKHILASPLDCWARSWMNPEREEKDSPFMVNGRAMHCRVIEPESFPTAYVPELDPEDYPFAIRTVDDAKEACRRLDLPVSGKKADLLDRLRPHDDVLIWEDLRLEYALKHSLAEQLPANQILEIEKAAAMIEKHPQLAKCFQGGQPEVSVFWEDEKTGVPMKCRIDYLKPAAIVEYKTLSNPYGKSVERAIMAAIAGSKYQIQAVFQKEGLKACGETAERQFLWVFQQQGVAPVARGHIFTEGALYQAAQAQYRYIVDTFAEHLEHFGTTPWVDMTPITHLDDQLVPVYATED